MGIMPKYSVSEPKGSGKETKSLLAVKESQETCMDQWGLAGARVLVIHFWKAISALTGNTLVAI